MAFKKIFRSEDYELIKSELEILFLGKVVLFLNVNYSPLGGIEISYDLSDNNGRVVTRIIVVYSWFEWQLEDQITCFNKDLIIIKAKTSLVFGYGAIAILLLDE
jgi:hypothetical protein